MTLPRDKLNKAMEITQEFGPERGITRSVRLRKYYPGIKESLISELLQYCDAVEQKALQFAEAIERGDIANEVAKKELSKIFPLLDTDRIAKAIEQALYFLAK